MENLNHKLHHEHSEHKPQWLLPDSSSDVTSSLAYFDLASTWRNRAKNSACLSGCTTKGLNTLMLLGLQSFYIYNYIYTVLYHLISWYIFFFHLISWYIILCHDISSYIMIYHLISSYINLYHLISSYINIKSLLGIINQHKPTNITGKLVGYNLGNCGPSW